MPVITIETPKITKEQKQQIVKESVTSASKILKFRFWCKDFTKLKIATFSPEY